MQTFETPEPITATIEIVIGDVQISAGDRDTTVVAVKPSDASNDEDVRAAEQTRVEYANEQLRVKAPKLRSWLSRSGGGSVDVTVELPAGSNVHGVAATADFHTDGRLGYCRIKTGLGDIQIDEADTLNLKSGAGRIGAERATGHTEVNAGSGEVRLGELGGSAQIKNANGDTWVGVANRDLQLGAANGNIAVDVAHAGVGAKCANGDVRIGEVVRGSVWLETSIGDLEVGIREGTAAWLDVNATAGRVDNALDAADAPDASSERVEVRARTTFGRIAIRRP
jgi:Putative adhesin